VFLELQFHEEDITKWASPIDGMNFNPAMRSKN